MISKLKCYIVKYLYKYFRNHEFILEIAVRINKSDMNSLTKIPKHSAFAYIENIKLINHRLKIANEPLTLYFQIMNDGLEFNTYFYNDFIYIKSDFIKEINMNILRKNCWLTLCNKNIFLIRPTIKQIIHLKTIQLCCNLLSFLPDEICELKNLNRFLVSKNKIKELPKNFGLLRNLRELNVASNLLTSIPKSFTSLRHLSFLILNDNKIKDLSHELAGCFSLKYLFIARNKIETLGAELMLLPFLRTIDYQDNPIEKRVINHKKPRKLNSLREICARKVINCQTHVPKNTCEYIKGVLVNVRECYFCGGSFFENWFEVNLFKVINEKKVPFKAKICKPHFRDQSEYISKLLYIHEHKIGYHLCNENYPKISELFILTSYPPDKLAEMYKYVKSNKEKKQEKAPLFTLIDGHDTIVDKDYISYADMLLQMTYKDDYIYSEPI